MKSVYKVEDQQGKLLVVLADEDDAAHLAQCTGGASTPIQVCETLEEYVVAITMTTTIAEEINYRKSFGLPCDIDQIVTRRSRSQAIGVAASRAESTLDLDAPDAEEEP